MISKSSGNETHTVHDIFDTENTSFLQNYLYIDNDYIYFMKGNSIKGISLSDFHGETFWKISDDFDGFLGVNFQKNQNQDTEFVLLTGFFLINGDMFQIYNNKVEKNGKIIIDDTILGLSCNGKNI